jgi:hypothetical protein
MHAKQNIPVASLRGCMAFTQHPGSAFLNDAKDCGKGPHSLSVNNVKNPILKQHQTCAQDLTYRPSVPGAAYLLETATKLDIVQDLLTASA